MRAYKDRAMVSGCMNCMEMKYVLHIIKLNVRK